MLSWETWNELLDKFLGELAARFPSRKSGVETVRATSVASTLLDESKACTIFVAELLPYARRIADRDGSMFGEIGKVAGVELSEMYAKADDATRETIFEYLQTLLTLGNHLLAHL
jgi:hypothetical protein